MRVGYLAGTLGEAPSTSTNASALLSNAGLNLGNLVFWYAARRLFLDPVQLVQWNSEPEALRKTIDILVIPAANFLNPAFDLTKLADIVEGAGKPVIVWGLGAQSQSEDNIPVLKPGTLRFLHAVAGKTESLFVRGEFTASVCRHYGIHNVTVAGCPSLFTNPNAGLGRIIASKMTRPLKRLYVAGATYDANSVAADVELFHEVARRPGSTYVIQDPAALVSFLMERRTEGTFEPYVLKVLETLRREHDLGWAAENLLTSGKFFTSVPEWLANASGHDFAISLRIHGAVVALMSGVPSIVVGHDARVRELAVTMQIPHVSPADLAVRFGSLETYSRDFRFDGPAFDSNRQRIAAKYFDQLTKAGLQASPFLEVMA